MSAVCIDQGGSHLSRLRPKTCVANARNSRQRRPYRTSLARCVHAPTSAGPQGVGCIKTCALRKAQCQQAVVGPPRSSYQRVMLHADDRASGDSLILESGGQLESCHTFIENTGRTLLGDLPMTGHCRAKRDTRWGLQEGAAGKDCTGLAPDVHLTGPCDPEEAMWFSSVAFAKACRKLGGACMSACTPR